MAAQILFDLVEEAAKMAKWSATKAERDALASKIARRKLLDMKKAAADAEEKARTKNIRDDQWYNPEKD